MAPVTVEQIQQWIREGRANTQTRVQPEGGTEWKALGELPQFSASFSGSTVPPATGPANVEALTAQISARSQEIDIASCISRGWNLVKNNFWRLMGTSLLIFLLLGGVGGALRAIVNTTLGVPMRIKVHITRGMPCSSSGREYWSTPCGTCSPVERFWAGSTIIT